MQILPPGSLTLESKWGREPTVGNWTSKVKLQFYFWSQDVQLVYSILFHIHLNRKQFRVVGTLLGQLLLCCFTSNPI